MPRQARVVAVGAPHHITQRGNNRQDVFLVDQDRLTYLELLAAQSRLCGLVLLGYCFSRNQPRFLVPGTRFFSLQADDQPYPFGGHSRRKRFHGPSAAPRPLAVGPVVQPPLSPERPSLAGPLLLLRSRPRPLGDGFGVRGPQPGPSRHGRLGRRLSVVECPCTRGGQRCARHARLGGMG
jgi:hypothetical protein